MTFLLRFSFFSAVFIIATLWLGRTFFPPESIPVGTAEDDRFTVIIDAGHGGRDGGASAADGTLEKHLNLAVAKKLEHLLRLADVRVVMTRSEDIELASPDSDHKKRDDLNARLAMTEQYENAILVSIHMNTFPVAKYSGLQVYYSKNHAKSLTLAEQIQKDSLSLKADNDRTVKASGDSIFLLSHAKIPAVLVECGFLSNPEEAALLANEDYQRALARLLFLAIMEYQT
jgi:N-acetylmuramoyl-L-alanine amidase